jgi:hypothetical protein
VCVPILAVVEELAGEPVVPNPVAGMAAEIVGEAVAEPAGPNLAAAVRLADHPIPVVVATAEVAVVPNHSAASEELPDPTLVVV